MTVRAVEGKKPYTGGKAIEITEDKVINLKLRDENNLIIWDEGDNEIYVDLQLPDEIRPTDAFPVGVNTGRVIVDNGWDVSGTILVFKTTSGDNVKFLYGDDGKLYIDNGTGSFKQIYLKGEVDLLLSELRTYIDGQLALKEDKLTAGPNITIQDVVDPVTGETVHMISATGGGGGGSYTAGEGINIDIYNEISNTLPGAVVDSTAPSSPSQGDLWYDTTNDVLKSYDGTNWNTVGGGGGGGSYTAGTGINIDSNNQISNTLPGAVISSTAPSSPVQGSTWYDTTTDKLKSYNGTSWDVVNGITGLTLLSYGHSTWNDFLTAFNSNTVVYCKASSNSNPGTGTQGRMAFMAFVNISGSTPTSVEFQYYRSVSTHSDAQQGDQVFVYKLESTGGGTWSVTTREAYTKIAAGSGLSSSYSNGTLTLNSSQSTISVTLTTNGWSSNTQTVTATGVTSSNTVIVSPDPSSMSDYTSSGVYCSAQGTDSLTFTCATTPSNALTVNVVILN